jgi:hypothetical protein
VETYKSAFTLKALSLHRRIFFQAITALFLKSAFFLVLPKALFGVVNIYEKR